MLEAGLDVAQLHGTAQARGTRIWRAYSADESVFDQMDAEALLIDTPSSELYGGTGQTLDWSLAKELQHKIIIAGGLDAGNVRLAIEQAQPWGVDACSRIEKSPGQRITTKCADLSKRRSETERCLLHQPPAPNHPPRTPAATSVHTAAAMSPKF